MKISNKLGFIIFGVFIFFFYRFFISTSPLVAHDWPLLFGESRNFSPFFNMSWDYMGGVGIGSAAFKTLWIDLYTNIVYALSNSLNLPWWLSQRVFWIAPFIAITLYSSYKFSGIFVKKPLPRVTSVLIYSFNTYILLIVAGGQFGVAFAYGLVPLVFYRFIKFLDNQNFRNSILTGIFSGLVVALDPRIALISFAAVLLWIIFFNRKIKIKTVGLLMLSFLIAILLNSYWLLPIAMTHGALVNISDYSSLQGVKFLSFANFSNSLSLLHPNWPENIFGKVYFFRPEFLFIPIFAFSTLLLKAKKEILFFSLLALVAAYLGKGTNDPFSQIYSFLFQYLPGFTLFRDSTKFFILIALSYSILIPYLLENSPKLRRFLLIVFVLFWLVTLKPVWSGEVGGIFNPKPIPSEYAALKEEIKQDNNFYRILWVPVRQKYGYFYPNHPGIDAAALYKTTNLSSISGKLKDDELDNLSIRYIIIPEDVDGEIFLKDRKYDEKQYANLVEQLDSVNWLKRIGNGRIAVFENTGYKEHFWSPSTTLRINYKFKNPTEYEVTVSNVRKADRLIFSEGFDKNWKARRASIKYQVSSIKYDNNLNSFVLPEGSYELKVYYEPQKWVNLGLLLSTATILSALTFLIFGSRFKKW